MVRNKMNSFFNRPRGLRYYAQTCKNKLFQQNCNVKL